MTDIDERTFIIIILGSLGDFVFNAVVLPETPKQDRLSKYRETAWLYLFLLLTAYIANKINKNEHYECLTLVIVG